MRINITLKVDYDMASISDKNEMLYALEKNIERHIEDDMLMSNDYIVDAYDLSIEDD